MSKKQPKRPDTAPQPVLKTGSYVWRDGSTYNGEYLETTIDSIIHICRHGTGTFDNKDSGLSYSGGWLDDKFCGAGTIFYPDKGTYEDGTRFEGEWNLGYPQGKGAVTTADGQKWNGAFADGKGFSLIPEIGV
ncbi:hypothetical protein SeMB42_g05976 [Synchytrium endobioticum]|uniref:MORN repeat-containing protein 5 n=1 Tax=Synchytrium endobioticum TaxID=286115 RepID=A0A507CL45_9FUNG|nr:hypothetical protein SeMB42_g05976 [Synchytrium endobioticum]